MLFCFSGTKAIQRRKQIEARIGFIKLVFFFCTDIDLALQNLVSTWIEFRLGFKEEAIITKNST